MSHDRSHARPKTLAGTATLSLLLFSFFALAAGAHGAEPDQEKAPVAIVVGPQADRLEHLAGEQLARLLERIYPKESFRLTRELPAGGRAVLLGTATGDSRLQQYVKQSEPAGPGGFVIKTAKQDDRRIGVIAGADPRATLHAVYALAERLGYGFYLSYDAAVFLPKQEFDFQGWELVDAPLYGERIVFNWHNFLSSCSTWDLPEWQHWIRQAAKMRYTSIMVHAYGNNPMVCFTHNGQTKPVGYLSTTVKGRDWGTQHVNDVRLLYGAQGVFEGPVFGCRAAMVPEEMRVAAAKALMKQVFAYAENQGVDVVFALDVDTASSNPPNVINTLPASARFSSSGHPLANPDAPEGFAYYKTQIETLLSDYPQIDRLVVWFRSGRTLWRNLKPKDFPDAWKVQYDAAARKYPQIADDPAGPSMFAISKIVGAVRRVLDGMGREDVKLGIGSWHYGFMPAADAFMPPQVAFIPLDSGIQFETPQVQATLAGVGAHRPVIPVVWAHHDDRTYVGRPYRPFDNFASQLEACKASGFGIIHWTTRPLDIYFKSLAEQTWKRTRDLPLEGTCRQMAARTFGPQFRDPMARYLLEWVTTAPQFGRETSDRFIDRPLANPEEVVAQCRKRLEILKAVHDSSLDLEADKRLEYYGLLEEFFIEFYRSETALQESISLLEKGNRAEARAEMAACRPQAAIELYGRAARSDGISAGEKALIISMNLRWLPYFEAQRQALGRAVRINFQPTQHDPLAQGAGHRTFCFTPASKLPGDHRRQTWLGLGEKETGVAARRLPPLNKVESDLGIYRAVLETCIESDKPVHLKLTNIIGSRLTPGTYDIELYLSDGESRKAGQNVFDLALRGSKETPPLTRRIDIAKELSKARLAPHTSKLFYTVRSIRVDQGHLDVQITPVHGWVHVCGVVIDCTRVGQARIEDSRP